MDKLIEELKVRIIEVLNLTDETPDNFELDGQLVGGDMGIDSIDVLEMVMMVEEDYGVVIDNKELGKEVFKTLRTLAEYIHKNSPRYAN